MTPELVCIHRYMEPIPARLALIKLREAGIACELLDQHLMDVQPLYGPALGGMRLLVRAGDAAAAREILSEVVVSNPESPRCPDCGCSDIAQLWFYRRMAFFTALLAFPIGRAGPTIICKSCEANGKPD